MLHCTDFLVYELALMKGNALLLSISQITVTRISQNMVTIRLHLPGTISSSIYYSILPRKGPVMSACIMLAELVQLPLLYMTCSFRQTSQHRP